MGKTGKDGVTKAKSRLPKLKTTCGIPTTVVKYGMDGSVRKLKLAMQQIEKEKPGNHDM